MSSEEERCAAARKFARIDDAFRRGDLQALGEALGDPALIPNGALPEAIGNCLIYAIYWSPLSFIRTLLEAGADPAPAVDDGFPPLIAALVSARDRPGAHTRDDLDELLKLLLSFGADPSHRGINDYTALHMAVNEQNGLAVQRLLDAGADPTLRTRIDQMETAEELALKMGLTEIAATLARGGAPLRRRLRSGLTLLVDVPGAGEPVRRQHTYRARLRNWLHRGESVRWIQPSGPVGAARLDDDGTTLVTDIRIHRGSLIAGIFYGVDGMRVGGMRRLEIAPHLAYGERGVPGMIPPGAVLVAEITILATP